MNGFDDDKPRSIFDLKGWLVFFNVELDLVLSFSSTQKARSSLVYEHNESSLELAVLALEDRYFYTHKGVDFRCFYRVLTQILKNKRLGGVSTIEQQYVRTVLNRKEREVGRKANELILARLLWYHMGKRHILNSYISCAYFGYKLNGCDAASDFIFGVKSNELSIPQAVFVASLLVYPLPKAVKDIVLQNADPKSFLASVKDVAPSWAGKIERRMDYGLKLLSDIK